MFSFFTNTVASQHICHLQTSLGNLNLGIDEQHNSFLSQ